MIYAITLTIFFTTIASKLVSKLPLPTNKYCVDKELFENFYHHKGIQPGTFKLAEVSQHFIFKELNSLNPQKATGMDNISPKFLKDSASVITPAITHIINLSITSGQVPEDLKVAKVSPLYKKNDKLEVGNYRPISVLNTVSKILEKSVYVKIQKYLDEKELIYRYQSGFRPGHSTETCLLHLTDYIKQQTAKGFYTGMLLLDVQKAFDSVDHTILCKKLYAMGIDPTWFISYLSNRKQLVCIDGVFSDYLAISCGVPQGSLLGHLLYLCYSNDMEIYVSSKLLLYADDSVLIVSDRKPDTISKKLSEDLGSCNEWLIDNKLSLHVGKTECIVFGSKRKLNKLDNFSVSYGNSVIKGQRHIKYLGVVIDQCLSGDTMANNIIAKTLAKLKFLYRYKNCLNQTLRKNPSMALLQCHLDYCATTWYPTLSVRLKNKLQTTQNKIARYILNYNHREHIGRTELSSISFINIKDRVEQLRLNHVFKVRQGTSPKYLFEGFFRLMTFIVFKLGPTQATSLFLRLEVSNQKHFTFRVLTAGIACLVISKKLATTIVSSVKLSISEPIVLRVFI